MTFQSGVTLRRESWCKVDDTVTWIYSVTKSGTQMFSDMYETCIPFVLLQPPVPDFFCHCVKVSWKEYGAR